jgi:hypothetical protein
MNEIYCTQCEQVIGRIELDSLEAYGTALETYQESTRCDSNHTEEIVVGVDEENNEITKTIGTIGLREVSEVVEESSEVIEDVAEVTEE